MKILVINCGSSSLKFKLFAWELINKGKTLKVLAKGMIEISVAKKSSAKNHREALDATIKNLIEQGIIKNIKEINIVGHRVVHGGEKYTEPTILNDQAINEIKKLSHLAPLHNPPNLAGISACRKIFPKTKQIAIFDTAFHKSMPIESYLYGIPFKFYKKNHIRRYGFHGISHEFITKTAIRLIKKKNPKIISCHLGNGSSIAASINGKCVDTSMGFTPMEGVIMGTRSGSIDPGIIIHMSEKLKLSTKEIDNILNNESGLKGISEISSDMRIIYKNSLKNIGKSRLAIDIFSCQIAKHCAGYMVKLNNLDALVFSGGIGENAFYVREKVCEYLNFLGIKLDNNKNKKSETLISDKKSKVKVFVIKTDEELQIAQEIIQL
ncbi:acetate kinase [Candidatus Peregrinibacteria bacterium]|nr:acetate kinase [Candidatus Peregrinibacteria bacterium]